MISSFSLSTLSLSSIFTTDTFHLSIDLTDVNSVFFIEEMFSNQNKILIDLNDEVKGIHNDRLMSDKRKPSVKKEINTSFHLHLISVDVFINIDCCSKLCLHDFRSSEIFQMGNNK